MRNSTLLPPSQSDSSELAECPTARQTDSALRSFSAALHRSPFTFHKSLFPPARIWILFAQNYAKTFATGFSLECHSLAVIALCTAFAIAFFFFAVLPCATRF